VWAKRDEDVGHMKLLKEPLLHFIVAGAVLFAAHAWLGGKQVVTNGLEPVRIGKGEVAWLTETWSKQWLRQPSSEELKGLIDGLVNEELLAREAKAIGLDQDDTIIRRRLAQKLNFLVEDTVRLADPTEDQLRTYYGVNASRYQTSARLSFMQLYFNPKQHQDTEADAKMVLAKLQTMAGHDVAVTVGDPSLLNAELRDVDEQAVTSIFGPQFSRAVFALAAGVWSGPLKSDYGDHLVFVETRTPAMQRHFEEVRDKVLEAWRTEQQQTANRDYIGRLRNKYGIVFDDSVKPLLEPEPTSDLAAR
jgi:hypothetical protein